MIYLDKYSISTRSFAEVYTKRVVECLAEYFEAMECEHNALEYMHTCEHNFEEALKFEINNMIINYED